MQHTGVSGFILQQNASSCRGRRGATVGPEADLLPLDEYHTLTLYIIRSFSRIEIKGLLQRHNGAGHVETS